MAKLSIPKVRTRELIHQNNISPGFRNPGQGELAHPLLRLQQTIGNRAVQRLIRAEATTGATATPAIQRQAPPAAPAPPKAPAPAPQSDSETISMAIALFSASSASSTKVGLQVRGKLNELFGENEITFKKLEGGTRAEAWEGIGGWGRYDIAVRDDLRRNVVLTSLRLVHEAIHHLFDKHYLDEEMEARSLQIDFYMELEKGIAFGNYQPFIAAPGTDTDLEDQRNDRAKDKLIDHIMSMDSYRESCNYKWVKTHIGDWGGIKNRETYTKARYLQVLADDNPLSGMNIILDLLESEASAASWGDLIRGTGGNDYKKGLSIVREAIDDGFALYSNEYWYRIKALQDRWGVYLGIKK